MALPTMQKKHFGSPDEVARFDRITKENVVLDGVEVHRVTFAPGARWSDDLKPYAQTDSCPFGVHRLPIRQVPDHRCVRGKAPPSGLPGGDAASRRLAPMSSCGRCGG